MHFLLIDFQDNRTQSWGLNKINNYRVIQWGNDADKGKHRMLLLIVLFQHIQNGK